MTVCNHSPKLKCIHCAPELWHPGPEYIAAVNARIIKERNERTFKEFNKQTFTEFIENLLNWKRAYYHPEDPEVDNSHFVPDSQYDSYENILKRRFPNHPFLDMVDWEPEKRQECLDWEPDGGFN